MIESPNLLAQISYRLPPSLPTKKQCIWDFAWFETIYTGEIIKCRIHTMNLAHSVSEKNTTLLTAKEETSHVSHPVSASDTYFMIMAEGLPNSGLYHSFTLKLRGYSWLFLLAPRPSCCWAARTIYQVRSLIYQSQPSFVLHLSVLPSHMAVPLGVHRWHSSGDLECHSLPSFFSVS